MEQIFQILNDLNIPYELQEHKAIFSEEDSKDVVITLEGTDVKNLFVKDKNNKKIYIHEIYRNNNYLGPEDSKGTYFVFFTSPTLTDKSTKEKISSPLVYVENQNNNQITIIIFNNRGRNERRNKIF